MSSCAYELARALRALEMMDDVRIDRRHTQASAHRLRTVDGARLADETGSPVRPGSKCEQNVRAW